MDPEFINSVFAIFYCLVVILYKLLIVGLTGSVYQSNTYEAVPGVLMNRRKRAFISGEQRKKAKF